MLFDVRGGRRRVIQVIYLSLAILMGGGLVLFGIGGGTNGGLFDAFSGSNGTTSSDKTLVRRADAAAKRARLDPKNAPLWAALARARYQVAGQGSNFNQTAGTFTASGKRELALVEQAWDRYLALDPSKPDDGVASLMAQVFGPGALNKADKAAQAIEIVAAARPSPNAYATLAQFAYQAGQLRKGDLAAAKAVALSPKDQRASIKDRLAGLKSSATTPKVPGAAAGATTTP
jgi:hypothetical protein